ncbi:Yos1-like protein [Staphylotrichum tortipilum]|uniref:Yos1-like protein n=1 Tax=Staphylotrichum tortipilum TaxID=2831512 RepID=A0AAN6MN67_9PEZI|nr:Yos1-like protein [Staphylotrichum longicolle]
MSILGKFLYITVLLLNAICIPSEDRFLARVGLAPATYQRGFGQDADSSVKYKVIQLIASVRTVMRVPLIIINTLIIVYELILG